MRKHHEGNNELAFVGSANENDEVDVPPAPVPDGANAVPDTDGQSEAPAGVREALQDILIPEPRGDPKNGSSLFLVFWIRSIIFGSPLCFWIRYHMLGC